MLRKIAILLPAYNVAQHIEHVLSQLLKVAGDFPVFIVDDGSVDETNQLVSAFAQAQLLSHERNQGKGAAIITGITAILASTDAVAIIMLDSDGQHNPANILDLIAAYENGLGNFIIGRRTFSRKNMPLGRICSNLLTSFVLSAKLGERIWDSQSGFRLISRPLVQKILPELRARGYEIESEILIKAHRAGAKICEVPIDTYYGSETSYIRPLRDSLRLIKTFFTA